MEAPRGRPADHPKVRPGAGRGGHLALRRALRDRAHRRPGERIALEVLRHHRLLELYLTEALGISWDHVHVEAERLEHVLSDELEASIDQALGHPATDPHGDPIPTADLVIAPEQGQRLADL